MTPEWPRRGLILAALLVGSAAFGSDPVSAGEREDAQALGTPLTAAETDQARLFCADALRSRTESPADPEVTCDCFQLRWQKRTNRLHRLALAISLLPNSPQARAGVWKIGQLQDGLHDARLEALSTEFRQAAQDAMGSCSGER